MQKTIVKGIKRILDVNGQSRCEVNYSPLDGIISSDTANTVSSDEATEEMERRLIKTLTNN